MTRDRLLHGFNALLYALNGFLWEAMAHQHGLAFVSICVAIGSAIAYRKIGDL